MTSDTTTYVPYANITLTPIAAQYMNEFDAVGFIPSFLHQDDPRPAREQFNERYVSGWRPFDGFTVLEYKDLSYPGDPPTRQLAHFTFRDETIRVYQHSWVMIEQKDGSFEISRMD